MPSTAYSSGGEVEHSVGVLLNICRLSDGDLIQLFMIGGIIFFVVELKFNYKGGYNVAQLFLELLCKPEFSFLSCAELVYSGRRNERGSQLKRPACPWFTYRPPVVSFLLV